MEITNFADLLTAARRQSEPQRLLFVFAGAELPANATAEQRAQFEAGEAAQAGPPWAIVFSAALAGRNGRVPGGDEARALLQTMVDSVKSGRLDGMLAFNRHGVPVRLG